MENTCDRCGALGKTRFVKGKVDLVLCGHHANEFIPGLMAAGFRADSREVSDHPALVTA